MKKFDNPKELFLNIVGLQEESRDILQDYVVSENVTTDNYIDKLSKNHNELANYIYEKLDGESANLNYLINNIEEESDGDVQLVAAFIRAYITEQIIDTVISFEKSK